jgi:hypothetical protein
MIVFLNIILVGGLHVLSINAGIQNKLNFVMQSRKLKYSIHVLYFLFYIDLYL